MAAFKVGDKVRIVGRYEPSRAPVGGEGIIVRPYIAERLGCHYDWEVSINGEDGWFFPSAHLAPLLPPDEAADQFIARIKKLGSEPVNEAPKERMTINGDVGNGG